MSCKLDLPLGPSFRDSHIEADLQGRLDDGRRVWAIGDIHGHLGTFRALIHRLKLGEEDRVVCLGDMIDRGPDSAGLIDYIRSHPQIICLKGNHELMAITSLQEDGHVELWQPWLERGGRSTWGSYIVRANGDLYEAKELFASDLMWMDNLPNHIVLDDVRLVHAGYDPRMPLDLQGDKELLWIRKRFYAHEYAVDPNRTVIFGHSTTTKVGPSPGSVAQSEIRLSDGRPAWIAMDIGAYNHVSPGLAAIDIKTFQVVKQATLRSERWFDVPDCREAKIEITLDSTSFVHRIEKKLYLPFERNENSRWLASFFRKIWMTMILNPCHVTWFLLRVKSKNQTTEYGMAQEQILLRDTCVFRDQQVSEFTGKNQPLMPTKSLRLENRNGFEVNFHFTAIIQFVWTK